MNSMDIMQYSMLTWLILFSYFFCMADSVFLFVFVGFAIWD